MKVALSTVVLADNDTTLVPEDLPTEELVNMAYENDEAIQDLRKSIESGNRRVPSHLINMGYKKNMQDFSVRGSRVWLKDALVVPNYQPLRLRLLQEFHETRLAGHPGAKAMFKALSEHYWWSRQRDDVQRFAKNCHYYRRHKPYSE